MKPLYSLFITSSPQTSPQPCQVMAQYALRQISFNSTEDMLSGQHRSHQV
ncbi:hypothetical protein [Rufibacter quisquiliarum]|uniref:Uncharacterized protein n=1 Tax=Rufibacter quisquiliarum TaxID=1549639 RepID=A0A839GY41_9BACT|nr:hypothetical protein [Rufibacter quisquiliarum]MBA9078611.1 hypothetical protein [Rufibacter quisquiliarum]